MGLSGEREGQLGWAARLLPPVRIGLGEGGGAPLSFSLPTAGLLPLLLYIRGQGAPLDTQVDPRDHIVSRVRCPFHHNPR